MGLSRLFVVRSHPEPSTTKQTRLHAPRHAPDQRQLRQLAALRLSVNMSKGRELHIIEPDRVVPRASTAVLQEISSHFLKRRAGSG